MLPEKTVGWGKQRSTIRTLFEYGCKRKAEIGAEKVFDFSLGNPSIPAPKEVNETIISLMGEDSVELHGYTTAAGRVQLRQLLAEDMNKRFNLSLSPDNLYVTCGAAASLAITLKTILYEGDEVIAIAPFFPEYRVFTEAVGGKLVVCQPDPDTLEIDLENVEACITEKTRAVIINSPNNPSGNLYKKETIIGLCELLKQKERDLCETIYLISDEPYRELIYSEYEYPCIFNYYADSVICYSFSKSLSIPGERIGYIAVNPESRSSDELYAGIMGAGRALGYVNPPSLFQRVIEKCYNLTVDIDEYKYNRHILCDELKEIGYEFIEPQGAFYLFVKSLEPDAKAFSERAKEHELLLVPSDDFGIGGYVRIAYCVSPDMIKRSMTAFKALKDEYDQMK